MEKVANYAVGLLMLFAAAYVMSIAWKMGQKGMSFTKKDGESGFSKVCWEHTGMGSHQVPCKGEGSK